MQRFRSVRGEGRSSNTAHSLSSVRLASALGWGLAANGEQGKVPGSFVYLSSECLCADDNDNEAGLVRLV